MVLVMQAMATRLARPSQPNRLCPLSCKNQGKPATYAGICWRGSCEVVLLYASADRWITVFPYSGEAATLFKTACVRHTQKANLRIADESWPKLTGLGKHPAASFVACFGFFSSATLSPSQCYRHFFRFRSFITGHQLFPSPYTRSRNARYIGGYQFINLYLFKKKYFFLFCSNLYMVQ